MLTARVNIIYSNAELKINSQGQTLREVTERGLIYARAFYAQAGIRLDVKRFEARINASALNNINGPISTAGGDVMLSNFLAAQSKGSLSVLVSGDLIWTGKTVGVGGPSLIGTASDDRTLVDELGHALGSNCAFNDFTGIGNTIADSALGIEELRVNSGLGIGDYCQGQIRETLERLLSGGK